MNAREKLIDHLLKANGPQLEAAMAAEHDTARRALAAELQALDAKGLATTKKLRDQRELLDKKVEELRREATKAEDDALEIAFDLSAAHSAWTDRRDQIWSELRTLAAPPLAAFAEEIRRRLGTTMPGHGESVSGAPHEIDAYRRSLMAIEVELDILIRTGVDGKAAATAIEKLRRSWPRGY